MQIAGLLMLLFASNKCVLLQKYKYPALQLLPNKVKIN